MSFLEELLTIVGNYGFPMALSIYLLVRLEGKINALDQSIQELANVIAKLT